MNYKQAVLKRNIELILIAPFIFIGKIVGYFYKLKTPTNIFLFFPSMDIGGSPKVNLDIINLLKDKKPLIIFSKKPNNNGFKAQYEATGCKVLDLHKIIDNKYLHFLNIIFRGIISTWINNSPHSIVFGGECIYFYKIVPHVKPSVRKIELSHLDAWLNYNQSFIKYIDWRITSTPKLKRNIENLYKTNGVPEKYLNRLLYIDNFVEIPEIEIDKNEQLSVLFVGRGSPQKRVHIVSAIAEAMLKDGVPINFTFVGDVTHLVSDYVAENCKIFEYIKEKEALNAIYNNADVLILTSAFEGLPIVVMDMMARAKVVLSTAVDGIPDFIETNKNGILIEEINNEDVIKQHAIKALNNLISNRNILESLGVNARITASQKFSREVFEKKYLKIFDSASIQN
jgi:L-malate glycosyltransferase